MSKENHFPDQLSKSRKISRFICQELLYDYIEGKLDEERKHAVKEYLKTDSEMAEELEAMKSAIVYCQSLSKTEVSEPVIEKMKSDISLFGFILNSINIKNWSEPAKWIVEAVLISSLVGVLGLIIPWEKITLFQAKEDKSVLLAKRDNIPIVKEEVSTPLLQKPGDDVDKVVEKKLQKKEDLEKKVKEVKPEPVVEKPVSSESVASQFKKVEEKKTQSVKKVTGNPFVYRMYMVNPDVLTITDALVEKIKSFSGVKAGKVKLGWPKPNGSYFHFSIPEENYEEFLQYLNTVGKYTVEKSAHRRVMPAGTVRVVLWIQNN